MLIEKSMDWYERKMIKRKTIEAAFSMITDFIFRKWIKVNLIREVQLYNIPRTLGITLIRITAFAGVPPYVPVTVKNSSPFVGASVFPDMSPVAGSNTNPGGNSGWIVYATFACKRDLLVIVWIGVSESRTKRSSVYVKIHNLTTNLDLDSKRKMLCEYKRKCSGNFRMISS